MRTFPATAEAAPAGPEAVDRLPAGYAPQLAEVGAEGLGHTGLTWGYVYATGVTICYPEGCVGDLAQSDAYAAPGDSGGSWFDGPYAVGLTSGGGGGWTFFQPVVEALHA